MSRKHYIAIAEIIKNTKLEYAGTLLTTEAVCERIAKELASVLAADNPNFNRGRFLQACGVQP